MALVCVILRSPAFAAPRRISNSLQDRCASAVGQNRFGFDAFLFHVKQQLQNDQTKSALLVHLCGDFVELTEFFFEIDDAGIVVVDGSLENCHFLQFVNHRQNLINGFTIHR